MSGSSYLFCICHVNAFTYSHILRNSILYLELLYSVCTSRRPAGYRVQRGWLCVVFYRFLYELIIKKIKNDGLALARPKNRSQPLYGPFILCCTYVCTKSLEVSSQSEYVHYSTVLYRTADVAKHSSIAKYCEGAIPFILCVSLSVYHEVLSSFFRTRIVTMQKQIVKI